MTKELKMEKQLKEYTYSLLRSPRIVTLIIMSLFINYLDAQNAETKGLKTVVIDAGHGGKDPGTVVGKVREKDVVLDIALKLGKAIKEKLPDIKVIYTRKSDTFIPLFERSVIANKNNADLFISIHANFCSTPSIKGTETYVLGLHRTEDNLNLAKKENSVILLEKDYSTRYEGFNPNLSESYIMFELVQNANLDQSVEFAGLLQDTFRKHAQRASRDVRQAGFLVLRETIMPSVLIETGYLSNPAEAGYLMSDSGRKTIALAIYNSFKTYKDKFESRLNTKYTDLPHKELKGDKNRPVEPATVEPTKQNNSILPKKNSNPKVSQAIQKNVKPDGNSPEPITFGIQICAYPKKLPADSKLFKGIKNISKFTVEGYFKYYCLETSSFSDAKKNLATIRTKIPDAFIIAFKNGQPVPLREVIKPIK